MIISPTHRFIFVRTKKTGGASIEARLYRHCSLKDVETPLSPPIDGHVPRNHSGFFNHMEDWVTCVLFPHEWDQYYTFCAERSPWDKTLSHYCFRNTSRHGPCVSFRGYLPADNFCLNLPRSTQEGAIIMDRVLRYERLDAEPGDVFSHLGIPLDGSLDIFAKAQFRTDRRNSDTSSGSFLRKARAARPHLRRSARAA